MGTNSPPLMIRNKLPPETTYGYKFATADDQKQNLLILILPETTSPMGTNSLLQMIRNKTC
jgi:hypothetical protein